MNHGRKFAFSFLLLSILMLPRLAAAQADQPAILQIQNNGVTVGTAANYHKINFTAGCTPTFSNGGFNIACTGTGTSFTAAQDLSGNATSQNVIGMHFGTTAFTICSTVPTAGQFLFAATSSAICPNSLVSDSGSIFSYAGTGGITAPSLGATGPGSGLGYLTQGADNSASCPANSDCSEAPASISTAFTRLGESAGPSAISFEEFSALSGTITTKSFVQTSGTGNVCLTTNCAMVTPALGIPSTVALTHATYPQLVDGISTGITGSNGLFTDYRYFNCASSQYAGATLDVTLNQCWAAVITNLGGVANAMGINDASGLNENITSLVQTNQLLAPTLTAVATGAGTAFGSAATVTVSYAITSPQGLSDASSEASITLGAGCPGTGNCFVQMATPAYPGSGTTYTPYMATSTGYAGLACPAVAIGSTQGYGTGTGGCNGSAVSKSTNQTSIFLLPAKATWNCNLTATACILAMDHSIWRGELPGSSGGTRITTTSSTNLSDAIVGTDRNAKNGSGVQDGGQTYTTLSGFSIVATAASTVAPIGLRWSALADSSRLENLQVINGFGTACYIYATGYAFTHNLHCDSNNGAGGSNLIVGKSGANSTSLYADKLVLVHPSNTTSNLVYAGATTNLVIGQLDIETNLTASCNGTVIDLGPSAAQLGFLSIGAINIGANCASSAVTDVKIESNMNQVDIGNLSVGGQTGVTPISDLRTGAASATPFTWAQCSTNSSELGPCEYHVKRTPAFYATGLEVAGLNNVFTPIRDQTRFVLAIAMTAADGTVGLGTTGSGNTTFSWPVTAANWYDLQCKLPVTFAASATIAFKLYSVSGGVTVSNVNAELFGNTGASAAFENLSTIGGTSLPTSQTPGTSAPGTVNEYVTYDTQFLTSHAGNVGVDFVGNGTNNVTMLLGGECGITQIN